MLNGLAVAYFVARLEKSSPFLHFNIKSLLEYFLSYFSVYFFFLCLVFPSLVSVIVMKIENNDFIMFNISEAISLQAARA